MSEVLTVTDINNYIKELLSYDNLLNNITVKGEISNLKAHGRGHLYFSLKDENSKINCVFFNYKDKIAFNAEDGMSVQIKGKVNVYVASGQYQIYVNEMINDGVGNLYQLFEQLKQKLNSEGLFNQEIKKKLPRIPKKIGVITAPTGAAVKDIISTINSRYPLCEIIIFPSLVQGEGSKENIVKMIKKANEFDLDLIILGRGGGSIEDLWAFNEEVVARSIYESKIPIVSAVGHEIDYTISDFVADLRAPTPTGAASLVVPDKNEILRYLHDYKGRLYTVLKNKLNRHSEYLQNIKDNYILKNPQNMYQIKEQKLDNLIEKLENAVNHKIKTNENKLNEIIIKLELLNPVGILKKGYSIVKTKDKIIKSKKDIKEKDIIEITLSDGSILSEVKEVK